MKRYTLQCFVSDIDGKPRPAIPSAVGEESVDPVAVVKTVSVHAEISIRERMPSKHAKAADINKAIVLYAFEKAEDSPEMSVAAGEELILLENSGDGWSRCRKESGEEGYVPT